MIARIVALHGFLGLPSDWSILDPFFDYEAIDLWRTREPAFSPDRPVLLGYSMGGRLAMRFALEHPERWSAAVFVSAHPGLSEGHDARLASDLEWAQKFREMPWEELMRQWNSQGVLQGRALPRLESDFDRACLSRALDEWSLGRQRNLRADLARLSIPTLYVTGAEDAKFTSLMKGLERHEIVEGAGHRVPWDQPETFRALLRDFLDSV